MPFVSFANAHNRSVLFLCYFYFRQTKTNKALEFSVWLIFFSFHFILFGKGKTAVLFIFSSSWPIHSLGCVIFSQSSIKTTQTDEDDAFSCVLMHKLRRERERNVWMCVYLRFGFSKKKLMRSPVESIWGQQWNAENGYLVRITSISA